MFKVTVNLTFNLLTPKSNLQNKHMLGNMSIMSMVVLLTQEPDSVSTITTNIIYILNTAGSNIAYTCLFYCIFVLTLILLKLITLCHQYRARSACTSVHSDQALYYWLTNFQVLILICLKLIMDSAKKMESGLQHLRNSVGYG